MKLKSTFGHLLSLCLFSLLAFGCSDDDDKVVPPAPETALTFALKASDITAERAVVECTPSDEERTYIFEYAEAALLKDLTAEEQVSKVLELNPAEKTGKQTLVCTNLTPETDYVAYALEITKGEAGKKLSTISFTTGALSEPDALTFMLKASDITAEHAVVECTPSDEERTYVFDVAEAAQFESLSMEEQIRKVADLKLELKKGAQRLECSKLAPVTAYVAFALEMNGGQPGKTLSTASFTTEALPATDKLNFELKGYAGDQTGANKTGAVTFEIRCTTQDAASIEYFISTTADVERVLGKGHTLETIVDNNEGTGLIGSELTAANGEGFKITMTSADGVLSDTGYTLLVNAYDKTKNRVVERCDAKTDAVQGEVTIPEITVTASKGMPWGENPNSALTFKIVCTTKDVSFAEAFILDTKGLNDILQNQTLEELLDMNAGMGKPFTESDLAEMNSTGVSIFWNELKGNESYALLLNARNMVGGRAIVRQDATTDPDSEPGPGGDEFKPDVKVAAMAGDAYGMHSDRQAMVATRCFSHDAVYAACMFVEHVVLDQFMGQGLTYEKIMEDSNNFEKYSASIIGRINDKGYRAFYENLIPETKYAALVDVRNDKGRAVEYVHLTTSAAQ